MNVISTTAIDTLLFDLDGTLIDTLEDLTRAINNTLGEFSWPQLPATRVRQFIGQGIEHLLERSLEEVHGTTAMSDALPVFIRHYEALNGRYSRLYPGIVTTLDWLQQRGYKLACVTNKHERFARPLLSTFGLMPTLTLLISGNTAARKKPHPDPLLLACAQLGSQPAHTVMVGDSTNDVRAAHAAGCRSWCMTYGYGEADLRGDLMLDNFADIPDHLKKQ